MCCELSGEVACPSLSLKFAADAVTVLDSTITQLITTLNDFIVIPPLVNYRPRPF
jgi:hypothetical protein